MFIHDGHSENIKFYDFFFFTQILLAKLLYTHNKQRGWKKMANAQ